MKRIVTIILISLFILPRPPFSEAQGNPQPISYGQTVEASLATPLLDATYAFNAQQGDMVTIEMQAVEGNLDPFLILLDGAQTNVLAVDNDGGGANTNGSMDARIRYVISTAGVYVIKAAASPAQTQAAGTYRLRLSLDNPTPTPSAVANAPLIAAFQRDQDLSGDLSDATPFHLYRVQAAEAEPLSIDIKVTGSVTAGIYLYNADFSSRIAAAELGQQLDVIFPASGVYFLVVGRIGLTGSGTYSIRSVQPTVPTSIRSGETIRSAVTVDEPVRTFTLPDAQPGREYTIRAERLSGDLVPYIYLISTDTGAKVFEAQGTTAEGTATLTFAFPPQGSYALIATREGQADGVTTGDFSLVMSSGGTLSTPAFNSAELGILLVAGQTQTIDLTNKVAELYRFDATRNSTTRLDVVAAGEVYTLLADAQFTEIAVSIGALRDTPLPGAGPHYVVVMRRFGPNDPNGIQFTMTLQGGVLPPTVAATRVPLVLGVGQSVRGQITDEAYAVRYSLAARAGEVIRVRMDAAENSTLDPSLTLLDANENLLIFNDDAAPGITDALFEYEFSADGQYIVVATRSGEASGTTRGAYLLTAVIPGSGNDITASPTAAQDADTAATGVTPLTYGSRVSGSIDSDRLLYYYSFEGKEGDIVNIQMGSDGVGDLDSMLYLYFYGPDNVPTAFAANDNHMDGTLSAAITQYTLPQTGTYVIIATRAGAANGTTAGGFILILSAEN